MTTTPKIRDVSMWKPELAWETRADGTTLIWREDTLTAHADRITDRALHWAEKTPDRTWMAQRGPDGAWRKISYADLARTLGHLGQALLDRNLSVDRPLLILSENSLEHAMIALAAQHVGIASAAISPAYSLVSTDYGKLRDIIEMITPGMIFAQDGAPFAAAIAATVPQDVPVASVTNPITTGHETLLWQDLTATPPRDAVRTAHAAVNPDTVAKFLFTSGTTGSPKAVIQTNRMLCANQEMILDCYAFMRDEPPVVVDWAPWNHTASGNKVFNMILYHGGTYYIDDGKPTPKGIAETIRNLKDISPSWYFNVPAGYEMLVEAMETDTALRETFFRDLKLLMYAGAGLALHTWNRLKRMSEETIGERVLLATGLGSTETAPFSLFCTDEQELPGNVGIPSRGITMKLVPVDDKLELRLKGPNITPGYWRSPDLTAAAFDEEGFYKIGDALRYAEPGNPAKGFFFDGRIAENFKLQTGTWVAVGKLRAQLTDQMGGLVRDVVISGENRKFLGAILVPFLPALRALVPDEADLSDAQIIAHPVVRQALAEKLAAHAAAATGSATRVVRALLIETPLHIDKGEVTDKGSVNQRAVLRERPHLVEILHETGGPRVIEATRQEARA
ncbi:MAG: feruloyl-CoA synthase [Qingshengfaniella sp.]